MNKGIKYTEAARNHYKKSMNFDNKWQGLYLGEVESSEDPDRIGRLKVHIPELNSAPSPENRVPGNKEDDSSAGFLWCHPIFPFFGSTEYTDKNPTKSAKSYGFWGPMPDVGDLVIVSFLSNGIPVWLGCYPKTNRNFMMPGVGAAYVEGEDSFMPANETTGEESERTIARQLADNIKSAGLQDDNNRGTGTSSAMREAPSLVQGIKTRGYGNNTGHAIWLDDHPEQNCIRLRTSSGHQITMSDTTHSIYVSTEYGESWVELSSDGKIDIYSGSSVNVHSVSDVNVRVDGNYNLDVGGDMNMAIGGDAKMEVGGNMDQWISGYLKTQVTRNNETTVGGEYSLRSQGKYKVQSNGKLSITTSSGMDIYSTGTMAQDSGATVEVNKGLASLPDFSSLTDIVQSTVTNFGAGSTDLGRFTTSIGVSSLVSGMEATQLSNITNNLASTGLPIEDISGVVGAMNSAGINPTTIQGHISSAVSNLSNLSSAQLSQLTNLGLSPDQLNLESLGLSGVLNNLSNVSLPESLSLEVLGEEITTNLGKIGQVSNSLKSLNNSLQGTDLNLFLESARNVNSNPLSNIDFASSTALSSILSTSNFRTPDTLNTLGRLDTVIGSNDLNLMSELQRIRLDTSSLTSNDPSRIIEAFAERGLTLSDAQSIFGTEFGQDYLNIFNNAEKIGELRSALNTLQENNLLNNLLNNPTAGLGEALNDISSRLTNNLTDALTDIVPEQLSSVLNNNLINPESPTRINRTSLPTPSGTQGYVSKRVPQHEPWQPGDRIINPQQPVDGVAPPGFGTQKRDAVFPTPNNPTGEPRGDNPQLNAANIRYLIVHCSATTVNQRDPLDSSKVYDHNSVATILRQRNFPRMGYHYVINRDGSTVNTLPETIRGVHTVGVNSSSIGICVVGGVSRSGDAETNFTQVQYAALRTLLTTLSGKYPNAVVSGHRDFNALVPRDRRKDCPCFNAGHWWRTNEITETSAPPV